MAADKPSRVTQARPNPAAAPGPARQTTRRLSAEHTPGRYTRFQPKKKSVLRRIVHWLIFLTIVGAPIASFFVKTPDGRTYADAYLKPAFRWVKEKVSPPPSEETAAAKPAEKTELDRKFDALRESRSKLEDFLKTAAQAGADKAAETAAELEKRLGQFDQDFSATTQEIAAEFQKPRPQRKMRVEPAAFNAEFEALARIWRQASPALVALKETVAKELARKAEPPKPVEAPTVPYDLRAFHPWAARAAGTWVRWKTPSGLEDRVLRTVGDEGAVVRVQTWADGKVADAPDLVCSFGAARVLREEPLKVGDAEIVCLVVESGAVTRWIPKQGPGRIALKTVAGGKETLVTALAEEEIPVRGETKKCVRYEIAGTKHWALEEAPGLLVRTEDAAGVSEAIAWGEDPAAKPGFPEPPKPEAPAAAAEAPKRPHPWAGFQPGAWARRRTLFDSPTAKTETGADTIVVEVTAAHVVQKIETLGIDGSVLSFEKKVPLAGGKMVSLEPVTVGTAAISCEVLETALEGGGVSRAWVAVDGRASALALALKVEGPGASKTAVEIGERKVPVAGRELNCLSVTWQGQTVDGPLKETGLYSEEVPGFEVLRETVVQTPLGESRITFRLIDYGSDPARKTSLGILAEDAASIERRKLDRAIAELEAKVIQASQLYRDVSAAARDLPADAAALKALLAKDEEAARLLGEARAGYVGLKEKAPESAKIDDKVAKIDRALELLSKYAKEIQARLK